MADFRGIPAMPDTMLGVWTTMRTKQTVPDFRVFSIEIKLRPEYIITNCGKCSKGNKTLKRHGAMREGKYDVSWGGGGSEKTSLGSLSFSNHKDLPNPKHKLSR